VSAGVAFLDVECGGRPETWAVAAGPRGLLRVILSAGRTEVELARTRRGLEELIRQRHPGVRLESACSPTACAAPVAQLAEYARGERQRFELELELGGTDFQRAVWARLSAIPYGEWRTYGQVAAAVGSPGAARAVGGALGANPVPVVLPCHRVLASRGIGGFTGRLEHKRALLLLEGVDGDAPRVRAREHDLFGGGGVSGPRPPVSQGVGSGGGRISR